MQSRAFSWLFKIFILGTNEDREKIIGKILPILLLVLQEEVFLKEEALIFILIGMNNKQL